MTTNLRIWHVGNWCINIGQTYVESPFEAPSKDVEVLNYAQPFVDALRAIPLTEVVSQPSWELGIRLAEHRENASDPSLPCQAHLKSSAIRRSYGNAVRQ
ncbi:MAG TPA: hypothetical protein VGJ66_04425 [Pyrinomonadaceae bacterium]|jgi:hypothetical protein